jgi:hypothetical protein
LCDIEREGREEGRDKVGFEGREASGVRGV